MFFIVEQSNMQAEIKMGEDGEYRIYCEGDGGEPRPEKFGGFEAALHGLRTLYPGTITVNA